MNILMVKLSAIGDVIHTLPALNALRKKYPGAHITWLVEEAAYPIVRGHKALDRVILSRRKKWVKGLFSPLWRESINEARSFIKELRAVRYDMVIDFQSLLKSAAMVALARGKRKIGFDKGMEHAEESHLFYNERIPPVSMEFHAIKRYLMLLEEVGVYTDSIEYSLPISRKHREEAGALLEAGNVSPEEKIIAVNPVAKWDTKLWSNKGFALLTDALSSDYRVVFTGGPGDQDTVDEILAKTKNRGQALNLAGKTSLMTLGAVLERAEAMVTTDTGPMHMAAALGTPVVAIFGPTAPWRTGPFGPGHEIIRAGVPCSPCYKRICKTKECMEKIGVKEVLDGLERLNIRS